MKSIHLISALLTTIATTTTSTVAALSSSSSSPSRYTSYLSSSPKSPIELNDQTYTELTAKPRDYFVATLFTARDVKFGCTVCKVVQPEWDLLARSWNKAAITSLQQQEKKEKSDGGEEKEEDVPRMVWGTLDFMNGRPIFQKMMLSSAPVLIVLPPTTGPHAKADQTPFRYDFNSLMTADQLTTLLSRALSTSYKPPIVRPINYSRLITSITLFLGFFTSFTVLSPALLPLLRNRNLWAVISLISVLLFTSGHMFNHIRKVPYVSGNGHGGLVYFMPGFQAQLGMESQIIAALYAVLSFATIILALKAPRLADASMQHIGIIIWGLIVFALYSSLLAIFRFKNSGYPFWLPPF